MNKYQNGKIYTIRCKNDDGLIYVGSTIQSLSQRFSGHKVDSKRHPDYLIYKIIENWNDWYIELLEDYPCETKEQLNKREGEIIREIGTLNKRVEGRTPQEYKNDNQVFIKEKNKIYYLQNKDKIKEQGKTDKRKVYEQKEEYKQKRREQQKIRRQTEEHKKYIKEYRLKKKQDKDIPSA